MRKFMLLLVVLLLVVVSSVNAQDKEILVWLTGSEPEVDAFANALGLAHVRNPGASGEYTVDHSAVLMLIDPDARIAAYFRPPHAVDRLEADLAPLAVDAG